MKLKNKLLPIIAPAAILTTVAPIALTSCNNTGGEKKEEGATTITYKGEKQFAITTTTYTMEFALDKNLGTGWTLTCGLHGSIKGSMVAGPKSSGVTVNGTKVTVACEASSASILPLQPGDYAEYGLTFTCRNSSYEELWSVNIDGFKVTYQGA